MHAVASDIVSVLFKCTCSSSSRTHCRNPGVKDASQQHSSIARSIQAQQCSCSMQRLRGGRFPACSLAAQGRVPDCCAATRAERPAVPDRQLSAFVGTALFHEA